MSSRRIIPNSCVSLLLAVTLLPVSVALAFEPFVGEVVSKKVNVRSGPSTNYYVVTRLVAGDRVEVLDAESGWYAVVPPPGCFSLISATHVDIGADGNGVVNGSRVRVRAGSTLDSHRYAVQLKLDPGAEVHVLGDEADGFLKIAPPPGAYVWVHEDYVERVPDARVQTPRAAPQSIDRAPKAHAKTRETQGLDSSGSGERAAAALKKPSAITPSAKAASPEASSSSVKTESSDRASTSPHPPAGRTKTEASSDLSRQIASGVIVRQPTPQAMPEVAKANADKADHKPAGLYEQPLKDADVLFQAEMDKPIADRDFSAVIEAFTPIAEQETDEVAHLYASRRLEQVRGVATTADAVRRLRGLADEVTKERKNALAERSQLRPPLKPITRGFDAKGELRESMIYTSPVGPRRYRLIDPDQIVPRTLCYVELPRDLEIDISQYLGRLVGVRARSRFIETESNVNPIPIVVAEELVVLDEPGETPDSAETAGVTIESLTPAAKGEAEGKASVAAASPRGE